MHACHYVCINIYAMESLAVRTIYIGRSPVCIPRFGCYGNPHKLGKSARRSEVKMEGRKFPRRNGHFKKKNMLYVSKCEDDSSLYYAGSTIP